MMIPYVYSNAHVKTLGFLKNIDATNAQNVAFPV